jgi:hypothetical protein
MGVIGKLLRRSEGLPCREIGTEEEIQSFVMKGKGSDEVVQKDGRGGGVIKCIMPASLGMNVINLLLQFKVPYQLP